MAKIIASVLDADFSKQDEWIKELNESVDGIQFDLMDNEYVPNNGVPKERIKELRAKTKLFFEAHLMVEKPEDYVEDLAAFGVDLFIFHVETASDSEEMIAQIKESGMKVGIAVNNKTPAEDIIPFLPQVDLALVMTVEAGFGGQEFNEKNLEKIKILRKEIDSKKLDCEIEVDGGINKETGKKCVEAGATVLVAGSSIMKNPLGIKKAAEELR